MSSDKVKISKEELDSIMSMYDVENPVPTEVAKEKEEDVEIEVKYFDDMPTQVEKDKSFDDWWEESKTKEIEEDAS